jgi:Sigma-70 region 2
VFFVLSIISVHSFFSGQTVNDEFNRSSFNGLLRFVCHQVFRFAKSPDKNQFLNYHKRAVNFNNRKPFDGIKIALNSFGYSFSYQKRAGNKFNMQLNSLTLKPNAIFSDKLENDFSKSADFYAPDNFNTLQRISNNDNSASAEILDVYGDFVWNLAKKHTVTIAETEDVVQKIFLDIWQYAEFFDAEKFDEKSFILLVAMRRIMKIEKGRV